MTAVTQGRAAQHTKRLTVGRVQVYAEPRDVWVGAYVAPSAVYVCLLPMLVIRWSRS